MHEKILVVGFAKQGASTVTIDDRSGRKHEYPNGGRIIEATQSRSSSGEPLTNPDDSSCRKERSENCHSRSAQRIWISGCNCGGQHRDDHRGVDIPFRPIAFAKRKKRESDQPDVEEKN